MTETTRKQQSSDGGESAQQQQQRVIVHVDLDCFYAQVEMLRVGISEEEPYILLQWGRPIAVNYSARAYDIKRFEDLHSALIKCPHLRYSHVPTYLAGETQWRYHDNPNKGTHKVSLDPYRTASRRIFDVLESFEGVTVEKGGIDEAFLDVTVAAQKLVLDHQRESSCHSTTTLHGGGGAGAQSPDDGYAAKKVFPIPRDDVVVESSREDEQWALYDDAIESSGTKMIPFRPDVLGEYQEHCPPLPPQLSEVELALMAAGCAVTKRIRQAVKDQLGYNVSAGVAANKMLAKLVSAANKPNKQTLLLPSRTRDYLCDFSFQKLRGFGGKLGSQLADKFAAESCGDMWKVPVASFRALFGEEEGTAIWGQVRGVAGCEMSERTIAKSILAQKVFYPAATNKDLVEKWASVLTFEIQKRSLEFLQDYRLRPHGFNVKLGGRGLSDSGDLLNQTFPMPWPIDSSKLTNIVVKAAEKIFAASKGTVAMNSILLGAMDLRPTEDRATVVGEDGAISVVSKQRTLEQMMAGYTSKRPRAPTATNDIECDDDEVICIEPTVVKRSMTAGVTMESSRTAPPVVAKTVETKDSSGVRVEVDVDADDSDGDVVIID